MTGAAVVLGLTKASPQAGLPLGLLLVGGVWAALALRTRHPETAYCAAAVAAGSLVYGALWLPISPLSQEFVRGAQTHDRLGDLLAVVIPGALSMAMLAGARVLRRWIRIPGGRALLWLVVCWLFLGGVIAGSLILATGFAWETLSPNPEIVASRPPRPHSLPEAILACGAGLVIGAVAGGAMAVGCAHGVAPILVLTVLLLRWIDPPANDLNEPEWTVVQAVWRLQCAGDSAIGGPQIAESLGWEPSDVLAQLWRPVALGVVDSTLSSYHCPRRPRRTC